MGRTVCLRVLAAVTAAAIVAAAASVLGALPSSQAEAQSRPVNAAAVGSADAAVHLDNGHVRVRISPLAKPLDGARGKWRPVLLPGTAVAAVALVAGAMSVICGASGPLPALLRRRYSLSLRGPPPPLAALIS